MFIALPCPGAHATAAARPLVRPQPSVVQEQTTARSVAEHKAELEALLASYLSGGDPSEFEGKYIAVLFADPAEEFEGIEIGSRVELLKGALLSLMEERDLEYAHYLLEASVSELLHTIRDPERALALAEPFAEDWLETFFEATGSSFVWIDCVTAHRLEGELTQAESLSVRLEALIESRLQGAFGSEPARDAILTSGIFAALADHQVQLSLGLPDFSRDRIRLAQSRLSELGTSVSSIDKAIFAANIAEEFCNLWVLAERHDRRSRVASEAIEALYSAGLLIDGGGLNLEALEESAYVGLLETVLVQLEMHQSSGWLLANAGLGRDIDQDLYRFHMEELERIATQPGLSSDSLLRTLNRLARERLRTGDLAGARQAADSASSILEGSEDGSLVTLVARLAVLTLESSLLEKRGATPDKRGALLNELLDRLEQTLEAWSDSELREGGLGFLDFADRREAVSTALEATAALRGEEAAFDLLMLIQSKSSLDRAQGHTAPTLADAGRALCSNGSGVLSFIAGLEELTVMVLDSSGASFIRVPWGAQELKDVDALSSGLTLPGQPGRLAGPAKRLGQRLFGGEIGRAISGWDHAYVIGRDLLRELPLGMVDWKGEPLGLQLPLTYLPSIPTGVALAGKWRKSGLRTPQFLLGELDGRPVGLSDSTLSPSQARALRRSVPKGADGERVRTASLEQLGSGLLEDAGFATVFAHGLLDLQRARPSGMWLGPSATDVLWCQDVAQLSVAQVMVLSACGAARTNSRLGDGGVGSLGGAMLEAGALTVVLAGAEVPRDATVLLTAELQERLSAGEAPAYALLGAKQAVAARPEFRDPYHWANFHAMGVGHRAMPVWELERGIPKALLWITAALIASVALFWLRRRADAGGTAN